MKHISPNRPSYDFFNDDVLRPAGVVDATIHEHMLILEAKLNNQTRDYTFKVLKDSKDRDTEIKLDTADIALITHVRLSCQKIIEKDNYVIPQTPDLTYADPVFFPGVKDGKKEVDAVNSIWNGGRLSIESKKAKRLTDFDTFRLQYIPETKVAGLPALGMLDAEKGFYPVVNPFVVSGKAETEIKLRLGYMISEIMEGKIGANGEIIAKDDAGKATEDTPFNVIRLRLYGLLAINASDAYNNWLSRQR